MGYKCILKNCSAATSIDVQFKDSGDVEWKGTAPSLGADISVRF